MGASGPQAVAQRDQAGPALMPDRHRMSASGSDVVARYRFGVVGARYEW